MVESNRGVAATGWSGGRGLLDLSGICQGSVRDLSAVLKELCVLWEGLKGFEWMSWRPLASLDGHVGKK